MPGGMRRNVGLRLVCPGRRFVCQDPPPIVLVHGMFGFDNIGPIGHWYGIPQDLRRHGASVYVTQVSSFNSSEYRGEQLLAQVEEIVAISGASKVNLFGHSHGNQSSRYVAGVVVSVVNGLGKLIALLSSDPKLQQDAYAGLQSLNTAGATDFNALFPAAVPPTACGAGAPVVDGCAIAHGATWASSTTRSTPSITPRPCRPWPSRASPTTGWSASAPVTWARCCVTTTRSVCIGCTPTG